MVLSCGTWTLIWTGSVWLQYHGSPPDLYNMDSFERLSNLFYPETANWFHHFLYLNLFSILFQRGSSITQWVSGELHSPKLWYRWLMHSLCRSTWFLRSPLVPYHTMLSFVNSLMHVPGLKESSAVAIRKLGELFKVDMLTLHISQPEVKV